MLKVSDFWRLWDFGLSGWGWSVFISSLSHSVRLLDVRMCLPVRVRRRVTPPADPCFKLLSLTFIPSTENARETSSQKYVLTPYTLSAKCVKGF